MGLPDVSDVFDTLKSVSDFLWILFILIVVIIAIIISTKSIKPTPKMSYAGGKRQSYQARSNISGPFPYHDTFMGNSQRMVFIDRIKDAPPKIENKKWSVPPNKIFTKTLDFDLKYGNADIVISSSLGDNHWEIADVVVDLYNEKPRVDTPGFAEEYSYHDYWYKPELHQRWATAVNVRDGVTMKAQREALHMSIQEARPAYASISKNLYYYFLTQISQVIGDNGANILDISAYGERAIAAACLGKMVKKYDGVDPNINLLQGYIDLKSDLELINNDITINFWLSPLEDLRISPGHYDLITYSPPPHMMEKYSGAPDKQSYGRYPTFNEWFGSFMYGLIDRARYGLKNGGMLAITMLDRDGNVNPKLKKIKDANKYVSKDLNITYVEATLMIIDSLGFTCKGAIGLSGITPWWVFISAGNNAINTGTIRSFIGHYPELWKLVGIKIINEVISMCDNSPENDCSKIIEFGLNALEINTGVRDLSIGSQGQCKVKHSFVKIGTNINCAEAKVVLEFLRCLLQHYIIEHVAGYILSAGKDIDEYKVATILGRWLMSTAIATTTEQPWAIGVDPMFPSKAANTDLIIDNFKYSGMDEISAIHVVNEQRYVIGPYTAKGIGQLYMYAAKIMADFMVRKSSLEALSITWSVNRGKYYINTANPGACLEILANFPRPKLFRGFSNPIMTGSVIPGLESANPIDVLLLSMRIDNVGAKGHHYTRPIERSEAILKVFGENVIIDLFASVMNSCSLGTHNYCSAYYDVESPFGSIGSALNTSLIQGTYIANPVATPSFVNVVVERILSDFDKCGENNELNVAMGFAVHGDEVNLTECLAKPETLKDKLLTDKGTPEAVKRVLLSPYAKAVYILDKEKYYRVNPMIVRGTSQLLVRGTNQHGAGMLYGGATSKYEDSYSVGVIMSKGNKKINIKLVSALGPMAVL